MEAKTISIIKRYIDQNPKLNNSQLARLIEKKSTLKLTFGSLQNYIAKVKAMPDKIVDTKPGNVTRIARVEKADESKKRKKEISRTTENIKHEEPKQLTLKDHIKSYLIAYDGKNHREICELLKSNGIGVQYTDGTLKNYISAAAKELQDSVASNKVTSYEDLFNKSKESTKKVKVKNHEIIIVDTASMSSYDLQNILDNLSTDTDNFCTVVNFDENINLNTVFSNNPVIDYEQNKELGINLLNAITTAFSSATLTDNKTLPTNITIIVSGGDNLSRNLSYDDVRYALDELKTNYNWNVNLVFTGKRKEEAIKLGLLLGIDSTNVTTDSNCDNIIHSMNNRINKLVSEETLICANYFK